jgi:hypothetical protein
LTTAREKGRQQIQVAARLDGNKLRRSAG